MLLLLSFLLAPIHILQLKNVLDKRRLRITEIAPNEGCDLFSSGCFTPKNNSTRRSKSLISAAGLRVC
jgi:hypothetical protein